VRNFQSLNVLNWIKSYSKFNSLECGNFSQGAGTPGTEKDIAFLLLAVKGFRKHMDVDKFFQTLAKLVSS
jgi:hypothetical protein